MTSLIVLLINSLPLNNVHTTNRHICDARKCSESDECTSNVSSAPVLVSVASSPVQAVQHGEYVAHAPLGKPTADQHTPHSTLPVGEHWLWYVCVPCTSASHTTRSDTTAYHYIHGKHGAGGSLAVDAAMWTVWFLLFFLLLNKLLPLSC